MTTLKDLAAQLGVSIATVSRALRSSPEIGPEMQRRVKELARKLNYRPNPFARSLRQDSPKIIGVVVPNMVTHYYSSVLDGIEREAAAHGYSVISANSHEDTTDEIHAVENFLSLHVDGIIACLAQNTTDYTHFQQLADMELPLVFFGRTCLPDLFPSVTANGDEAAYQATQHLLQTGSRRIAFLGGPAHLDMVVRRKHGYLQALRDARIPIERSLVVCGTIDFRVASHAVRQLLERNDRPDAILAMGLRIPEDVAIIGFTDDVHAEYVTPRLSAIVDQSTLMGRTACRLLLRNISGDLKVTHEIVPQKLMIRDTSDKNKAQ